VPELTANSRGLSLTPLIASICTQVLFAQLFPGSSKSLTSMCDRLVLDSSERDDRHGASLDADMTADALILMERQLKHGETGAPRPWTST
jgi:DNA polymerase III epsilon subunit-like protein